MPGLLSFCACKPGEPQPVVELSAFPGNLCSQACFYFAKRLRSTHFCEIFHFERISTVLLTETFLAAILTKSQDPRWVRRHQHKEWCFHAKFWLGVLQRFALSSKHREPATATGRMLDFTKLICCGHLFPIWMHHLFSLCWKRIKNSKSKPRCANHFYAELPWFQQHICQ